MTQDHLTREDQEEIQKVILHLKVLETEIIHQELKAKLLVWDKGVNAIWNLIN